MYGKLDIFWPHSCFVRLLGHEHMKDDVGTKGLQHDIEIGSNLSYGIGLKLGLDVNYGYILVVIFLMKFGNWL